MVSVVLAYRFLYNTVLINLISNNQRSYLTINASSPNCVIIKYTDHTIATNDLYFNVLQSSYNHEWAVLEVKSVIRKFSKNVWFLYWLF